MYISLNNITLNELQTALDIEKKITAELPETSIFGDDNHISLKLLDMAIYSFDRGGFEVEITEETDSWDDSSFSDEEFHNSTAHLFFEGEKDIFFDSYREEFGYDYEIADSKDSNGYKVCSKLCGECPFSSKSINGWLADYSIEDFQNFMRAEVLFPCHMKVGEEDMSPIDVNDKVKSGELTLCRGYVESIKKSCKIPKDEKLAELVKSIELSEESMSIFEFAKHHDVSAIAG